MISALLLVISVPRLVSGETNKNDFPIVTLDEVEFFNIDSYKNKICDGEPTCKLINKLTPVEYTTLENRNCMCDADCSLYGDCCLDSKYYNENEQKKELFRNYHCSFQESVYMITSCPRNYGDPIVQKKCEKSTSDLDNDEIALIIPVTNANTRITYGNKYCAQCHGERNYLLWNETWYCSVIKQFENIRPDDFQQNYPVANLDNDTSSSASKSQFYRAENFADSVENDTYSLSEPVDHYAESLEATKYIKFNTTSKTFYSFFNDKNFSCSVGRSLPENLRSSVRPCKRFIFQCSDVSNETLVEKCRSYTSLVFDNYGTYRNKECALCNGVTNKLPGCLLNYAFGSAASGLFSTNDKVFGAHNPCTDPALKKKFCS